MVFRSVRLSGILVGWLAFCVGDVGASVNYMKWLEEEVPYVIADREREEFLSLSSDAEREDFVERFWQLRDPVTFTEENEFRQEHKRRIRDANRRFRDGKPGWKTDRGRTYIIHGPPDETNFVLGGQRLRISISGATEVLTGGLGDGRSSYPLEFPRPEAEIWIYNRLKGAQSTSGSFQIIFARADPSKIHYLHQTLQKLGGGSNLTYSARVQRDSAIMQFLNGRRVGGEYRILYAGEYKYPDLDTFYESIFYPGRPPSFTLFDVSRALRDLERSAGEALYDRLERKQRLKELVRSRLSFGRFELDIFCGSVRSESGYNLLPVTLGCSPKYIGDSIEILLELIRLDGTLAASFVDVVDIRSEELKQEETTSGPDLLYQTRLSARPGNYKLLIFARLQDHEVAFFQEREVVLEDYFAGDLALSNLFLFDRVISRSEYSSLNDPVHSRFLAGSRPLLLKDYALVPTADNRFRRIDKLTVFFEVYNPSIAPEKQAPALELSCRFWRDRLPLGWMRAARLDYLTDAQGNESGGALRTSYALSIPLNTFDPGSYFLEIRVYDQVSDQSVSSRTPFTVY